MNKKNILKIFSVAVLGLSLLLSSIGIANAEENKSFDLELSYQENPLNYLEVDTDKVATTFKKTTTGEIVYCGERTKGLPGYDIPNRWIRPLGATPMTNSSKLAFIYENGYHGQKDYSATKYLTGDKDKDYYITQVAVWYYHNSLDCDTTNCGFDFSKGTFNDAKSEISEKIANLINDAASASKNPSVSITKDSDKMSLSGGYYISSVITLVGKDLNSKINVSVSGANGAFVTTDKSATSGATSFNSGSKVYIKVPAANVSSSTKITLNISGKGTIWSAFLYEFDGASAIQKIVRYESEEKDVSASTTFSMNQIPVKISKKDIAGSQEVAGAHLVIKNSSGTTVSEWDSTTTAKTINLSTGKYTLTETIAPKGYIKSSKTITFTVNSDGSVTVDGQKVTSVIMTNEPIKVKISKTTITGKKELPGAILKLVDSDGKVLKDMEDNDLEWTSTDEVKEFWLPAGKYTLIESTAPKGYKLNEEKIDFEIKDDGKVYIKDKEVEQVTMTNEPIKIYIAKVDLEGKNLPGAKLRIIDENGNTLKDMNGKALEWVSTKDAKELWLPAGTYTLIEVEAPSGYELSDEKIVFEIDNKGNIKEGSKNITGITITMENTPEPEQVQTGNTILYVVIALGTAALACATYFVIKNTKKNK